MKVLITGGAGFIGAFVARALLERGDEAVLYDNFTSFVYPAELKQARINHLFPNSDKRPKLIAGDILDAKLLNTVMEEEGFDKVLHLAALANPTKSLDAAEEYAAVNVMGTVRVLEAVTEHDIPHLVFAGSSSVYNDEQTPFREDQYPLRPRSPYGASKAAAEAYLAMWHELHGLPITILRFFSVYGPWGRPDMAPNIFARQILDDETLSVSPDRQRDVTYIGDVVPAVLAALDQKFEFEIFNIGRGQPVPLDEMVEALAKAAGKTPRIETREAPPGEMRVTYADISKAARMLGYKPNVSIQEGAKHLIDWLKTQA